MGSFEKADASYLFLEYSLETLQSGLKCALVNAFSLDSFPFDLFELFHRNFISSCGYPFKVSHLFISKDSSNKCLGLEDGENIYYMNRDTSPLQMFGPKNSISMDYLAIRELEQIYVDLDLKFIKKEFSEIADNTYKSFGKQENEFYKYRLFLMDLWQGNEAKFIGKNSNFYNEGVYFYENIFLFSKVLTSRDNSLDLNFSLKEKRANGDEISFDESFSLQQYLFELYPHVPRIRSYFF